MLFAAREYSAGKVFLPAQRPSVYGSGFFHQTDSSCWSIWRDFCLKSNKPPFEKNQVLLSNFLAKLKIDRNIQVSTVARYKAAVESMWSVASKDSLATRVMAGLKKSSPVVPRYKVS